MEAAVFTDGGQTGLIILSGILLFFGMGIILLLFFFFSKKKIIQKELEKKEIELQFSRELLEASLEVQEKERKRIAQDLHDDISSKLNVVSLNCHFLTLDDLTKEKESEVVQTIIGLSSQALENSRRIAHNLFPPVFDKFGLDAAIAELCKEYSTLGTVTIAYVNETVFDQADKERHMHVFRILQELISNSVRHGKAAAIAIRFSGPDPQIACTYTDNGIGFDTEDPERKKGLGMKNIQSRINFLKGSLAIDSAINQGITVNFSF